jgi:CPA1 family monovalent cation:H+ antiporter
VEILLLLVGLMLAAVLLVGLGDRLRLPWPALMVVLGAIVAFLPGLPDAFEIDPGLILPLFLRPLLFATAQRTSWSQFRARRRTIVGLAVALVAATVTVVAGTAVVLVPGITVTAAVALGAMVAPPDPVAVEAVAGSVRIPRRVLQVLQTEGLFNDATALVIFQAALLATVSGDELSAGALVLSFVVGAVGAVLLGLVVAWLARQILNRVDDTIGRSALTLVLPFATYLLAEEIHASGVVAVVVAALQMRALADADAAADRLVQRSFWDVVELLVTGVAFGLIGLDLRQVVEDAGADLPRMLAHAGIVCAVVVAVRALWTTGALFVVRSRVQDPSAAPRTGREAVVITWCGMRGLATLALALSLPTTVETGAAFPARTEIVLVAVSVLLVTLLIPGFTLPALVTRLGLADDADAEEAAEKAVSRRASRAVLERLTARIDEMQARDELSEDVEAALHERIARISAVLSGESAGEEERQRLAELRHRRHLFQQVEVEALAAARAAVVAARGEPGVDPAAADRVLRRLDLRTVLLD